MRGTREAEARKRESSKTQAPSEKTAGALMRIGIMAQAKRFEKGIPMDMKKMMKQAQRMQRDLAIAQDEIKTMEFEASAGGGMVKAVALGDMTVKSITIDPEVIDPEDVEMLEDMVLAAVNEALRGVADMSAQRMSAVTGGMNIPGLM